MGRNDGTARTPLMAYTLYWCSAVSLLRRLKTRDCVRRNHLRMGPVAVPVGSTPTASRTATCCSTARWPSPAGRRWSRWCDGCRSSSECGLAGAKAVPFATASGLNTLWAAATDCIQGSRACGPACTWCTATHRPDAPTTPQCWATPKHSSPSLFMLRSKLLKDGPGFFRDKVVCTLHKSKQNRSEQPSARIFESVSVLLAGNASPFAMHLYDQTITLEAAAGPLAAWLRSPAFNDFVHIQQSQQLRRIGLDMLLSEDVAIAARCIEAFNAVKRYADRLGANDYLFGGALMSPDRDAVKQWPLCGNMKHEMQHHHLWLVHCPRNEGAVPVCSEHGLRRALHRVDPTARPGG